VITTVTLLRMGEAIAWLAVRAALSRRLHRDDEKTGP
jgi:hypothetical protein